MKCEMRKPTVPNKFGLTTKELKKYVVVDRTKVCAPLFWRNDVIGAWCISGEAGTQNDKRFGTEDSFWLGIYDEDAKAYAGRFRFSFDAYGGMCGYNFERFYDPTEIENENDLHVQEMFLEKVNVLIEQGIIAPCRKEKANG